MIRNLWGNDCFLHIGKLLVQRTYKVSLTFRLSCSTKDRAIFALQYMEELDITVRKGFLLRLFPVLGSEGRLEQIINTKSTTET